ncbi:hypothetical protein N7520_011111 [Penicillium odoratum]|uniref:uncharacterized protein n=1 Tax=Penicillium odoratum TaxID=1167516 RepID=UPI0025497984|nr:uncharacterized protein N7520_011111 [Penicillium odoratum]KAJ5745929.1 hypothetical protein N7520_011111 [Penicillium odoratum]
MSDIPPTMPAWSYQTRGPISKVLNYTPDFPTPHPSTLSPNEVLIKIAYSGFTPSASTLVSILPTWIHKDETAIPELEFSGTVAALGSNILASRPELQLHTPVFGITSLSVLLRRGLGTLAGYCPCPADRLSVVPVGMDLEHAAALGGNGITAVQVVDAVQVKRGGKVFVNGGSGGTGSMILQVVRERVGESGVVVASCSSGNIGLVKSLGADEVIDYRAHDPLHEYLSKEHAEARFDAIIDTVGIQELYTYSPRYLREGGRFVNIGAMQIQSATGSLRAFAWAMIMNLFWPAWLGGTPRWYKMVSGTPGVDVMARVKRLVEDGALEPIIDSTWEMEDALKVCIMPLKHRYDTDESGPI